MLDAWRKRAAALDADDPLATFREEFVIADPDEIYLDGNSLGRLPKRTIEAVERTVRTEWGAGLVGSWRNWIDLPQRLGAKIAGLIGADPDEVIVCDSTSVNLYKLTMALLARPGARTGIVTDDANFPSDLYITVGAAMAAGTTHFEVAESVAAGENATAAVEAALTPACGLLTLSLTQFKSGYTYDMARLTGAAHEVGALALWDLSHSVGAFPIDLHAADVDLAVGCGYKYLNGGPGAPAFLYLRRDLQSSLRSPIWGWFGQHRPFDFDLGYEPAEGIRRFLAGTPPVLSMVAMEGGIDLVAEAGLDAIRRKSVAQTSLLIELFDAVLAPLGFSLLTPRSAAVRGSHVSFRHPEAWRINQALIHEKRVIPDFRAPDTLRLGIAPLTTSFAEVVEAVGRIVEVMETQAYARYSQEKSAVT